MSAKEWSDQAGQLVVSALAAAQSKNNSEILALQKRMAAHKEQKVLGVDPEVSEAFNQAMDALFTVVVNNVVAQWTDLQVGLEAATVAIEGTAGEAAKAAKLIKLEPVTQIAQDLTALVTAVKDLKNNPQSADAVAQELQTIQMNLQNILNEAGLVA